MTTGSRLVRFSEIAASRWANGQGETVELWREPRDGDFAWRLSIATVSSNAPFSRLPGVERALIPLASGGLCLEIDGARRDVARLETVCFSGEASVRPLEVAGGGYDLNLMVRRAVGVPVLSVRCVGGVFRLQPRGIAVLVALEGGLVYQGERLGFGDTVIAAETDLVVSGPGLVATAWVD